MWPILDQLIAPQAIKEWAPRAGKAPPPRGMRDPCPGFPVLVPKWNLLRRGLSIVPGPGSLKAAGLVGHWWLQPHAPGHRALCDSPDPAMLGPVQK